MAPQEPPKKKGKTTLHSFFKSTRNTQNGESSNEQQTTPTENQISSYPSIESQPLSAPVENPQFATLNENCQSLSNSSYEIERDPAKRKRIYDWPFEKRDEIRRKYLMVGPYQPKLDEYKARIYPDKSRHFQYNWFSQFYWLEYSPTTHKAYCFPCFLFGENMHASCTSALVSGGFDNWKRVHQGRQCVFVNHIGASFSSPHNKCVACVDALMRPSRHIDKVIQRISKEDVAKNRLRLKIIIMVIQTLALQGSAFRGHDECEKSLNRGNVIEWIDYTAKVNADIKAVVLGNAPKNATYTSHDIQNDILAIMANRVRCMIRDEIGDACFSLLVDEAQDESGREQMAIILRFVSSAGILTERFFAIKGVSETCSETLKQKICSVLSQYNLQVDKLRGQGYDGASNMSGKFNGLKSLFLKDCPYAYFVHYFAHRLQLALVAAEKQCDSIWKLFSILDNVINVVKSSPKRNTELRLVHRREIEDMLQSGVQEYGRGANQMTSLQCSCSTRWSSHYNSVQSMINLYVATRKVLKDISRNGVTPKARTDAGGSLKSLETFNFVFNLHFMRSVLKITDYLCQAFQQESIDMLSALNFVSIGKTLLQELRDHGWEKLLQEVKDFCLKHKVKVPDLNKVIGRGERQMTLEHHYHVELFNQSIDFQLSELNSRFNETSVRLLELSVALDPKDSFKSFNADDIYKLAVEFYPQDFEDHERYALMSELQYYGAHVVRNSDFQVPTLSKLLERLVETKQVEHYKMICRLIRLVLTLPVSTATIERAFSAMKHMKTNIRNKMADEMLGDAMTIFIGREFSKKIDVDSVIDEFAKLKNRRVQLTF